MLEPNTCKTFCDHAINTFVLYIFSLLRQVQSVDLVWDRCFAETLKNYTRDKRGVGVRRKVTDKCFFTTNWMTLLKRSENKAELFPYLSNVAVK